MSLLLFWSGAYESSADVETRYVSAYRFPYDIQSIYGHSYKVFYDVDVTLNKKQIVIYTNLFDIGDYNESSLKIFYDVAASLIKKYKTPFDVEFKNQKPYQKLYDIQVNKSVRLLFDIGDYNVTVFQAMTESPILHTNYSVSYDVEIIRQNR